VYAAVAQQQKSEEKIKEKIFVSLANQGSML
jgi:hypothetical protein